MTQYFIYKKKNILLCICFVSHDVSLVDVFALEKNERLHRLLLEYTKTLRVPTYIAQRNMEQRSF